MICKFMIEEYTVFRFEMPIIKSNMFLVIDQEKALIIDPHESKEAVELLRNSKVKDVMIVLTHEHYDHISGVNFYREYWKCQVIGCKACEKNVVNPKMNLSAYFMTMFVTNTNEERLQVEKTADFHYHCKVDKTFEKNYSSFFSDLKLDFYETPGHSEGSICLIINDRYIFTGDSLIPNEKIITRLPGSNKKSYLEITKPFLEKIDGRVIVFPGHGEECYKKDTAI